MNYNLKKSLITESSVQAQSRDRATSSRYISRSMQKSMVSTTGKVLSSLGFLLDPSCDA
jgi:hypothetical protein